MKKTLLLCAFVLSSLLASAGDGLVAVGANVILLPSSRWDGDIEWKAWTWVYEAGAYGTDWSTGNQLYNLVFGMFDTTEDLEDVGPTQDQNGVKWYEPGFDMSPKEDDINFDLYDEETGDNIQILWEEHTAPFSSDDNYMGRPSYKWIKGAGNIADIYVRRTFTTNQLLSGPVYLACGHDDAPCEYYINGVMVYRRTGWETNDAGNIINGWNNDEYILLTDEQKALIKLNGEENVVAFHVHQNWGGYLADCGLYTKIEGGLDMGYTTPWEGKVLFNNTGGYNNDMASPSNNPRHPWSALYEAKAGDAYTFTMPGASDPDDVLIDDEGNIHAIGLWAEQLRFKTPIKIEEGSPYVFKATIESDKDFSQISVKLTDNDKDTLILAEKTYELVAGESLEIELPFDGIMETTLDKDENLIELYVDNFMAAFDFAGGEEGAVVTIKDISLVDENENKELWVGTQFFNYIDMKKRAIKYMMWDWDEQGNSFQREATEEEIEAELADEVAVYESVNAPEIEGRTETMAWTQVDFDDSMWDSQMMPTGSANYMPEQQSIWPSGISDCYWSSNYWIRRNFELDKVNERLSYDLNVCHDDVYETYVNGILLQKNVGWTNGKSPVQVHIPAKYLNVGKNVIATYIQQNWGGYFYDCGINVTEVDYNECLKLFNDVLAYAETDTLLTNSMKAEVQALIDEAKQYFNENKNDAVELRSYARELRPKINDIFRYSSDVKILKDTYDICRKMEDKGFWGTALDDAVAALDTCTLPRQWEGTLAKLRNARKATAMERHTEKFVGCVPESVTSDLVGDWDDKCPKYYLYNVGAKNFLGGGEAYGAHLALEYVSTPVMLINAVRDIYDEEGWIIDEEEIEGGYFIETFRPNGDRGVMDFMGRNGFIDVPMETVWELVPVEGKENVYNIARYGETFPTDTTYTEGGEMVVTGGGKVLLGLRNGDNALGYSYNVIDTDNKTPELETNQWMFVTREEMLALTATASEENPVDLSFLLKNPGYDSRIGTWWPGYYDFNHSFDDLWINADCGPLDYVYEAYNKESFNSYQKLMPKEGENALPNGTYKLMVQAYYRDGIEADHIKKVLNDQHINQLAIMYATYDEESDPSLSETQTIMPIHIEANKYPGIGIKVGDLQMPGTYGGQPRSATAQAGEDYFPCGLYWNELVFTIDDNFYGVDLNDGDKIKRKLVIGMDKAWNENTSSNDWCVWDNWRLKYYGGAPIDPDAIKGIESDEINMTPAASNGIYNLLGQKLSKVQRGVNIVGGKKISVK